MEKVENSNKWVFFGRLGSSFFLFFDKFFQNDKYFVFFYTFSCVYILKNE